MVPFLLTPAITCFLLDAVATLQPWVLGLTSQSTANPQKQRIKYEKMQHFCSQSKELGRDLAADGQVDSRLSVVNARVFCAPTPTAVGAP